MGDLHTPDLMVPICSLDESHRAHIEKHILSLSATDLYYRFGHSVTNEHVKRYADSLDFGRDELFGIHDHNLDIIAFSHLAFIHDKSSASSSEFGVSVLDRARGRGYGSKLFERAVISTRNKGVREMHIHVLSENKVMLNIVRKFGGTFVRDGFESSALLSLAPATLGSRITETLAQQAAMSNYNYKAQSKRFHEVVAHMPGASWFGRNT